MLQCLHDHRRHGVGSAAHDTRFDIDISWYITMPLSHDSRSETSFQKQLLLLLSLSGVQRIRTGALFPSINQQEHQEDTLQRLTEVKLRTTEGIETILSIPRKGDTNHGGFVNIIFTISQTHSCIHTTLYCTHIVEDVDVDLYILKKDMPYCPIRSYPIWPYSDKKISSDGHRRDHSHLTRIFSMSDYHSALLLAARAPSPNLLLLQRVYRKRGCGGLARRSKKHHSLRLYALVAT